MANVARKLASSFAFLCGVAITAAAAPGPDANNSVPVRTIQGYLMVVKTFINHQGPFEFLVDTGTNTTLIDPALAKQLSLRPKDRLQLTSFGKTTAVPRYFLQTFSAGPASISNLEALAVPLVELNALDSKIRGVLGMNFLLHLSFRLDYDRHVLELYPFPEMASVPEGLRVPVQINESRLLVSVASSAAPLGSWKLALDSGISRPLVFEERVSLAHIDQSCAFAGCLVHISSNLGNQNASTVRLRDISIAENQMPDTDVVILHNGTQKATDPQDGLLPTAMFRSVFFDRLTATLILSPSPTATSLVAARTH